MPSSAPMLALLGLLCVSSMLQLSDAAMGDGTVTQAFTTDWVYASATFYDGPDDFKQARCPK